MPTLWKRRYVFFHKNLFFNFFAWRTRSTFTEELWKLWNRDSEKWEVTVLFCTFSSIQGPGSLWGACFCDSFEWTCPADPDFSDSDSSAEVEVQPRYDLTSFIDISVRFELRNESAQGKMCLKISWIARSFLLLVAQDLWLRKDARKSVKANKAAFGPLHIATTGTEVAGSASRESS